MAASCAMQSILVSPMVRINSRSRMNQLAIPALYMPSLRRNANLRVKSMAEKEPSTSPVTPPAPQEQPISTRSSKMSTKFSDVLAFSGPAPERINGRLAMIGFVAAIAVELAKGQDVFAQISNGGLTWFLGISVVLSLASLVLLFKGVYQAHIDNHAPTPHSSNPDTLTAHTSS